MCVGLMFFFFFFSFLDSVIVTIRVLRLGFETADPTESVPGIPPAGYTLRDG